MRRRRTENNGNFFGTTIGSDLPTVVSVGSSLPSRSGAENEGEELVVRIFSDLD